jgi:hypothetical protein
MVDDDSNRLTFSTEQTFNPIAGSLKWNQWKNALVELHIASTTLRAVPAVYIHALRAQAGANDDWLCSYTRAELVTRNGNYFSQRLMSEQTLALNCRGKPAGLRIEFEDTRPRLQRMPPAQDES